MTAPSRPTRPVAPVVPDDWPAQAADRIEDLVGTVRDKTTGPVMSAARWVVYGLLAAIVGVAALLLGIIAGLRLIDSYLPDAVFGEQHMWASYLVLGLPLTLIGLILLVRAKTPAAAAAATDD